MLSFDGIVGQGPALALLRGLLERSRVPNALMFHGPGGVGKATVAGVFAAALICERPEPLACGSCTSCTLLQRGNHPDSLRVGLLTRDEIKKDRGRLASEQPDAGDADRGTQILIDQIRTLTGIVGLTPRQGTRRVFVIDPADAMNREAQNSLLKTLEEPPDRSVLILVTARPHLLLPTVRSRCFSVGFAAMRTPDLAAALLQRGLSRDEADSRAALAAGRLGVALALDLEACRARRGEMLEILDALASDPRSLGRLPAMASALAGKDLPTLTESLDLLEVLLRDAARAANGDDDALLHADLADGLARLGNRLGPARAAELVAAVERVRGYLRFNANRTLIAEGLLAAVAGGPLP